MRNIHRSATAVVLILVLAMPAGAAIRPSRSGSFLHAVKRFMVRVVSRISPPGGVQEPTPEEPTTTTTDGPTKTQ
jgi:hypothetical protein